MADPSVYDWGQRTISDSALHRSFLQNRSCANVSESVETATKMVLRLYHQRSLHVDRYPIMEKISTSLHCSVHDEHDSYYRFAVLHHGSLHHHDIQQDPEPSSRLHCCLTRLELASHALLWSETPPI